MIVAHISEKLAISILKFSELIVKPQAPADYRSPAVFSFTYRYGDCHIKTSSDLIGGKTAAVILNDSPAGDQSNPSAFALFTVGANHMGYG